MRFATGITLSGIIGLILVEVFKIVGPWVKVWLLGILGIAVKVLLIGFVLLLLATVVGVAFFFYKMGQKSHVDGRT